MSLTTPEQRAQVVRKTADFLAEHGWTSGMLRRHDWQTGQDTFCTLGALYEVEESGGVRTEVVNSLACAIGPLAKSSWGGANIAVWNDRHRNGNNVIAKLRAAADKIETGEC